MANHAHIGMPSSFLGDAHGVGVSSGVVSGEVDLAVVGDSEGLSDSSSVAPMSPNLPPAVALMPFFAVS